MLTLRSRQERTGHAVAGHPRSDRVAVYPETALSPRLSLIITTYNWPEALDLVLKSVCGQRSMPDEVIVADDGSGEPTARVVSSWARRLPVPVHHLWQENKGFRAARSRNRAIAAARGDYIVLLDGDMVLDEHFIEDHRRAAEPGYFVQGVRIRTDARCTARMLERGSTFPGILEPGVRSRHRAIRNLWLSRCFARVPVPLSRVKSCNQGYWRSDLIAVNGFDERMQGWGPEDKECAVRLLHSGVRLKELRFAALAVHLHHPSRAPGGFNPNDAILEETIAKKSTRCEFGLDRHLTDFAAGIPPEARVPWAC
jgi:glycosyltransferase involved in cell wall biosynthesis